VNKNMPVNQNKEKTLTINRTDCFLADCQKKKKKKERMIAP